MFERAFDVLLSVFGENVVVERDGGSFSATCVFEPEKLQERDHLRATEAWAWFSGVELRYGDEVVRQNGQRWHVMGVEEKGGLIKALLKTKVRPTP